jgi:hypothetical protein
VRIQGQQGESGYVVKITKKYMYIICDGGVFKVEAGIEKARKLGVENVHPYIGEVKESMQHWHCWALMMSEEYVVLMQHEGRE